MKVRKLKVHGDFNPDNTKTLHPRVQHDADLAMTPTFFSPFRCAMVKAPR
jgi:hypothetical protein